MQVKTLSKETLDKAIKHLKAHEVIDQEDVKYFNDRFDFTKKEYCDLANFLAGQYQNAAEEILYGNFTEFVYSFVYKEYKFLLRVMIGQGSSIDMFDVKYAKEYDIIFNEDKAVHLV